jgi:iron complex outermembrane recepter protein
MRRPDIQKGLGVQFMFEKTVEYAKVVRILALLVAAAYGISVRSASAEVMEADVPTQALGTAANEKAAAIDAIVVTANKFGSDFGRAPVSAISIDADSIADLHAQSLQDLQIVDPSLVYDAFTGLGQAYIRGIGTNQSYAGLESSVATYVDGVYLQHQTGSNLDLVDLASVQVLNGPQGALYGRNATGGVILVNTADPTPDFGGHVGGEVGNLGHVSLEAVLNIPLAPNLALRLAGRYSKVDGYVTNLADGEEIMSREYSTERAKLKWTPTDRLTLVVGGDYHTDTSKNQGGHQIGDASLCTACTVFGSSPPSGFYNANITPGQPSQKLPSGGGNITLGYNFDEFTLNSVTGYRRETWSVWLDQDFATPDLLHNTAFENASTFTHETFIRSHFGGPVNFLAGFTAEHDTDHAGADLYGLAFGPLQQLGNATTVRLTSYSGYGEGEYQLTDRLKLTIGARYNVDQKSLTASNNANAQLALGSPATFDTSKNFPSFTPRGVLSYEFDSANVYFSVGEGEKSGGYNAPSYSAYTPINSERLTSYELGAKSRLFDGQLHLDAATFYYKYQDIQVTSVNAATGSFITQNAASAHVYGLEANATWLVGNGWKIKTGGLTLDSQFVSYPGAEAYFPNGAGFTAGTLNLGGSSLPRSPKLTGYVTVDDTRDITNDWSADFSASDRYTTHYFFDAGGGGPLQADQQAGYNMGRASVTLKQKSSGVQVRLYMDNAFGAHYRLTATTSTLAAYYLAAPPRMYGLSGSISF